MSETLKAYGARVTVLPAARETRTAAGLHLPDNAQDVSQRGQVLDVGPDVKGKVNVGDIVQYSKYAGMIVDVDGTGQLVLAEGDILGLLFGPPKDGDDPGQEST